MYLRIGICEDMADELAMLLQALKDSSCECETESFSSGEDFLKSYYPGRYDLILMDIFMNGINGVETVARVRAVEQDVPIAFLTTSPEFTMEGYRQRVDRYILKPYRREDLEEVLALAQRSKNNKPAVTLTIRGKKQSIFHADISYAEQKAHSVFLHLTNGDALKVSMKLLDLAAMLPCPPFYHCHKSFLVNLFQVRYLDNDLKAFVMNDGNIAYIRRDSLRESRDMYSRFMFEQVRG